MQSPTHSQPTWPATSRSPAGPSAAARTLWAPTQQGGPSEHPIGQLIDPSAPPPTDLLSGHLPKSLEESGDLIGGGKSRATQLQRMGSDQAPQGPETPDAAMGGAPTAGAFWAQLEALCRSGLQAAAHQSQSGFACPKCRYTSSNINTYIPGFVCKTQEQIVKCVQLQISGNRRSIIM